MNMMTEILQGLMRRTEEGKLKWRSSADAKVFHASIDTTAVIIRNLGTLYRSNTERYGLNILNEDGVTVAELVSDHDVRELPEEIVATSEQETVLRRLFLLARQSALNADSTLEKLAKDLQRIR